MQTIWGDECGINSGQPLTVGLDALQRYGLYTYQSPANLNDERQWFFFLNAGTYTFFGLFATNNTHAILTLKIDGVAMGST